MLSELLGTTALLRWTRVAEAVRDLQHLLHRAGMSEQGKGLLQKLCGNRTVAGFHGPDSEESYDDLEQESGDAAIAALGEVHFGEKWESLRREAEERLASR